MVAMDDYKNIPAIREMTDKYLGRIGEELNACAEKMYIASKKPSARLQTQFEVDETSITLMEINVIGRGFERATEDRNYDLARDRNNASRANFRRQIWPWPAHASSDRPVRSGTPLPVPITQHRILPAIARF
ncbi:hypothetical protein FIBSPDRAFT_935625 [Athelia psychrophila]|uniref:Uncharacterized protein n=1 Tax=Athelia psychrophila TaxID=1759441 RepID=A0A166DIA0_9AGAM|nr:hypothetical protein FIBSPDRAFT_935625 [Fibularhizoctonia sp. CBS 109695]